MSSKRITIFRNIGVGFIFLLGIISCEKDLEDIAVDLTGQRPFDVGDTIFEVLHTIRISIHQESIIMIIYKLHYICWVLIATQLLEL